MSSFPLYLRNLRYLSLRREYGVWTTQVKPEDILFIYTSKQWPKYMRSWNSFVCPGNWDISEQRYEPFRLQQMIQLFREKRDYQETDAYSEMQRELRTKGRTRAPALKTEAEIEAYFSRLYALYESIKTDGFQTRAQAKVKAGKEITVRIGRDGRLIKCGEGTHRLAICLVLGIHPVPVVVDLVHPNWVRRCRHQFGGSSKQAILDGLESISDHSGY